MSKFTVGEPNIARTTDQLTNDLAQLVIMMKSMRREMQEMVQNTNYKIRQLEQNIAILDQEIERLKK